MSEFENFVQRELPKRPWSTSDGPPGYVFVRTGPEPRRGEWVSPAALGIVGGAYTAYSTYLTKGVDLYNLPYVAVAGIGFAFFNGLHTTQVKLVDGNKLLVTEFPPDEIDDDDELHVYLII